MEKEKMMECAMQIIAYAGSAFDYFNRAIEAAEEGQLEEARQYLADGKNELRHAHDAQNRFTGCGSTWRRSSIQYSDGSCTGSFDYGHFFRAYGRSFFETLGKEREVRNNG